MQPSYEQAQQARDHIWSRIPTSAKIAIVLGSGLSGLLERIDLAGILPYREIPHWPVANLAGHPGQFATAKIGHIPVVVLAGRVHLYEGFSAAEVAFPIRVLACLGIRTLIVTNAAGAIREDWLPGQLTLISDHINLQGDGPLAGPYEQRFGPQFPDMTNAYSPALRQATLKAASAAGIELEEGVYAGVKGSNYETPAEIRYLKAIGADLVGMSTVPEVIAARQMSLGVLGISLVSNPAAGVTPTPLTHEEVLAAGRRATQNFATLLSAAFPAIASTTSK